MPFSILVPSTRADASVTERLAELGSRVELECRSSLKPPITYSWTKMQGSISPDVITQVVSSSQAFENYFLLFTRFIFQSSLVFPSVSSAHAGTYVCKANNSLTETEVTTSILLIHGLVPYFAQAPLSYMVLDTIPDAYLKFDIEISFKPEAANGKSPRKKVIKFPDTSWFQDWFFIMLRMNILEPTLLLLGFVMAYQSWVSMSDLEQRSLLQKSPSRLASGTPSRSQGISLNPLFFMTLNLFIYCSEIVATEQWLLTTIYPSVVLCVEGFLALTWAQTCS